MRFSYEPTTGELSAYVKQSEFDLAANGEEYRVFKRTFDIDNLEEFLKGYANFIKEIFHYLTPDEQMQDVVSISTYKQGYTWRSIANMEYNDESFSFLENLMTYGLSIIDKECRQRTGGKTIAEMISKRDSAKLSLIMSLLNMPSLPEPYKKRKKLKNVSKILQKRLDLINTKLKTFEEKYGFSSEDMWKYYKDDELPEDNMITWIDLYQEKQFALSIDKKQKLAEDLVDLWMKES